MKAPSTPGVCRWCALPVLTPKGQPAKGSWHVACVTAFKLIHWPAETRAAVLERDNGICARCGRDAVTWAKSRHEIERLDRWLMRKERERLFGPMGWHWSCAPAEAWEKQQVETFERHYGLQGSGHSHGWQHDHIRPLLEADGRIEFWELANIQTLCAQCHQAKTASEAAARAAARKALALATKAANEPSFNL